MVEVGPLLSFSDPALESAFLASLHKRRLRMDCLYLSTIAGDNLLLMLLRLVPRAEWQLACPLLLDALAALLLLLCWYLAGSAAFIRHRPWLIGSMLVLHAVCLAQAQPAMFSGPTCDTPGVGSPLAALRFWGFEALHQLIPWTAVSCMVFLLPLKHAVPAQLAVVAALLLPPCAARRRRVSLQLCPTAEQHYERAAAMLHGALACLLPHPGSLWFSEGPLLEADPYYVLTAIAQLVFTFVVPLLWLARREWRARMAHAQGHSQAAVRALQRWEQQWRLGPFEWIAVAALVWCIGLAGPSLATHSDGDHSGRGTTRAAASSIPR